MAVVGRRHRLLATHTSVVTLPRAYELGETKDGFNLYISNTWNVVALDDIRPVNALRNSRFKVPIAVIALLLAAFSLYVSYSSFFYPYDYDEKTPIASGYYVAYQVSIYGPMFKGEEVEINYEVLGGESINLFIFDKGNLERWATGETFATLHESTGSKDTLEYTLVKDGDIYIVFENDNSDNINLNVAIMDKVGVFYGKYLYLIIGIILGIVGILALTGNPNDRDQEKFPETGQYTPPPPKQF